MTKAYARRVTVVITTMRVSLYLWGMSQFKRTLIRVLVIQGITLALLWLMQSRYTL